MYLTLQATKNFLITVDGNVTKKIIYRIASQ